MEKKLEILTKGKSYNCYSGSICYILKNSGTIFSEAVSFGLSGGLGFVVNCGKKISFSCVREKHCLTEFLMRLGVRVAELPITDYIWLTNYIQTSVDRNEPVMLRYDGFFLTYTPIYKKKHDVRIGLVTGYEDGYFYMTDFVYNVINYKISENEFFDAVFSKDCNKELFELFLVAAPKNIEDKVTKRDVTFAVLECVDFFWNSISTPELLLGLDGLEIFVSNIKDYLERINKQDDWDKLIVDLKQNTIAIKNYSCFFDEIRGTELTDISDKIIDEIVVTFRDASEQWNYFCNQIVIYKITQRDSTFESIKNTLYIYYQKLKNVFMILKANIKKRS